MNAVAAVQLFMSRLANDRIQMYRINSAHVIMLFNNSANSPLHLEGKLCHEKWCKPLQGRCRPISYATLPSLSMKAAFSAATVAPPTRSRWTASVKAKLNTGDCSGNPGLCSYATGPRLLRNCIGLI